jgi:Cu-Zn family superoxide dismutase
MRGSTLRKLFAAALVLLVPVFVLGAKQQERKAVAPKRAMAVIHPLGNNRVIGLVSFIQQGDVVQIRGKLTGLTPGQHAFHVHEWGDCSSSDGMSAGGHFNPDKKHHGGPHAEERHVGDLGNITAGRDGVAIIEMSDKLISLQEGPHSIIGRSLIIHAGVDDLKTDPSGNAGGRIGCGVVGIANSNPTPPK